jgi:hypothetical protein
LTNVYGPCQTERKALFLDWFSNIDMPDNLDWIVFGDLTSPENPLIGISQVEILMICCYLMMQ